MSVNPGFGGQSFIPYVLEKVQAVRGRIDALNKPIRLEVDGGVSIDNIRAIAEAGADTFVAGSAIFGAGSYAEVIAGCANASPKPADRPALDDSAAPRAEPTRAPYRTT